MTAGDWRMMNRIILGSFAVAAFIAQPYGLVAADEHYVPWSEPIPLDHFNLGADFTKFCDFSDNTPMSDKCYGFVMATVEIMMEERLLLSEQQRTGTSWNACIPRGLKMKQIIESIRPLLRRGILGCTGFCSSTTYIMGALRVVYPCN